MNMSTMEDVLWSFERNSSVYDKCTNEAMCTNNVCGECYCTSTSPILPETICDIDAAVCDITIKAYVCPGEQCSICMDAIYTRKRAYLSPCGHSFHKTCIYKAYEYKWRHKWCSQFKCPMCRRNINLIDLGERYSSANKLDQLENFWILGSDLQMPQYCSSITDAEPHIKGMRGDCKACINYRVNGT